MADGQNPPDYLSDSDEENQKDGGVATANKKGGDYIASFKEFMLKEEILRAVKEASFERPSEVQYNCIPHALNGKDLLCQAKAGSGKTAVFVLSILNQLTKEQPPLSAIVLCHTRELALQIAKEFQRFGKYLSFLRVKEFVGGIDITENITTLKKDPPHIVIGTPGRVLDLVSRKHLSLKDIKYFVVDECDNVMCQSKMRSDVQEIFMKTPHDQQVMMFSGTMKEEDKVICRQFMQDQKEITVEDNSKLVLNGMKQFFVNLTESQKLPQLILILGQISFTQAIIFVNQIERANALSSYLKSQTYTNEVLHRDMEQEQRFEIFNQFKENLVRILVTTDLCERGIDVVKVNMIINFDMPETEKGYMHRIGRAGRFETSGMAISFSQDNQEKELLEDINKKFSTKIKELPKELNTMKVD